MQGGIRGKLGKEAYRQALPRCQDAAYTTSPRLHESNYLRSTYISITTEQLSKIEIFCPHFFQKRQYCCNFARTDISFKALPSLFTLLPASAKHRQKRRKYGQHGVSEWPQWGGRMARMRGHSGHNEGVEWSLSGSIAEEKILKQELCPAHQAYAWSFWHIRCHVNSQSNQNMAFRHIILGHSFRPLRIF